MNKLKATIISQKHSNGLGRIEAVCGGFMFRLLVLEDTSSRGYGDEVCLLIKESEIAISKTEPADISISNRIPCVVHELNIGEMLCEIGLLFGEHRITSLITSDSAHRLGIVVGQHVYALVKANEIYLDAIDD